MFCPRSFFTEGKSMTKKELLDQLEQMRNSTQEAIKWLDMPPSYGKNLEALEAAIQMVKEHRHSSVKIRQLKRSLRTRNDRFIRRMTFLPRKEGA